MKKISIVGKGNKKEEKKLDFSMLVTILILLSMGLVMVASASSYYALSTSGNSTALLQRQLMLAIVGVIAMLFISKIDYTKYKKASYIFYIISILLLIAVLTPLGVSRNGAKRWLGFGENFTFQPSELMKIALVMATAAYISTNPKKLNNIKGYFIPFLLLMAVVVVMYLQKHMSGTIVMGVASISIIFASGINIKPKYVIAVIMLILVVGGAFIVTDEFRLKRIFSFLNPEENKGKWKEVFGNDKPIHIEIGMGKGDFIIGMAKNNPNINFIGIEMYDSVIVKAVQKLENEELDNLKLIRMDARLIEDVFDKEIDLIYLNFSDPWPKSRAAKKRLTHERFLNRYENIFKGKKTIFMKTDNTALFEFSIESLSEFGYKLKNISLDLHNSDFENNVMTEYERKFSEKGIKINRLEAYKD